MNSRLLIMFSLFLILTMVSCKKEYHCDCKYKSYLISGARYELKRKEAKDYKKKCHNQFELNGSILECEWVVENK